MLTKLYVQSAVFFDALKKDQRGVTAIEYALVAAGYCRCCCCSFFMVTGTPGSTGLATIHQRCFC